MPTFSVLDRQGNEILKRTGGTEGVVNEIVAKAVALK
jgi:hypothetical protein